MTQHNYDQMKQSSKQVKGEHPFDEEKIVTTDGPRKQKFLRIISPCIWILYGTLSVLRYFKTGDQFLLWTGLFIVIGYLILLLFRTIKRN